MTTEGTNKQQVIKISVKECLKGFLLTLVIFIGLLLIIGIVSSIKLIFNEMVSLIKGIIPSWKTGAIMLLMVISAFAGGRMSKK